jgi:hypothetical protein
MRKQARMRDGNRCRNCGASAKLSVHHLVKARNGGHAREIRRMARDDRPEATSSCPADERD